MPREKQTHANNDALVEWMFHVGEERREATPRPILPIHKITTYHTKSQAFVIFRLKGEGEGRL